MIRMRNFTYDFITFIFSAMMMAQQRNVTRSLSWLPGKAIQWKAKSHHLGTICLWRSSDVVALTSGSCPVISRHEAFWAFFSKLKLRLVRWLCISGHLCHHFPYLKKCEELCSHQEKEHCPTP